MRRELEGSRREMEALRKASADGGAAQKELAAVRRELENTKKQADVARADYSVRSCMLIHHCSCVHIPCTHCRAAFKDYMLYESRFSCMVQRYSSCCNRGIINDPKMM
jgi:hypothetical protein